MCVRFLVLVGQSVPWFKCGREGADSATKIEGSSVAVCPGNARNYDC